MTFSKTAYLSLTLPADPTAPGPEFDIRGIYKTRKVRTFDTNGNQTGYLFSANPAWQLLDAFISLHLKPHGLANEALITAEKDRIDFVAFKSAADFCDVDIGGGVKRFESHVVFLSETNLATIFDTLTALCRGYLLEQNGKLGLFIDQPRNSVYTFTRANVLASGFQAPAKPLRSLANRLVIKTRDIDSGEGTISKDFAPWTKTLDDEPHQDRVGRIIKKDFDLGANTRERAERVGRYWMNRSLKLSEQGRMVASPDAGALVPGDRVAGPARTDFSGTRDWEVIEISDNPDGTREVSLQAYDESIFSDTAETQQGIEETTIPTRAQTAFSPTGTHFYLRAVYKPDQLNGSADTGEIDFDPRPSNGDYLIGHPDGTDFVIANASRSLMSQAAQESYTGRVFIVFSKQKVNTERSLAAFQDSHIIVLRLNTSGAWEYDNNGLWLAFTPDPSDILIFEVDRSGSGWAGKPTRYVGQELLSATEAGRLQYASGATVESLEPGEAGANVTETRTAALIASQGALATKSNVDLGTAEVLNKTADNIAETGAKKWAGETGADVTGGHQAATIASQGALATQSTVGVGDIDAGAVDTPEVKADAINEVDSFSADGTISTTSSAEIEVADVTVASSTGTVEVIAKCLSIPSAVSSTIKIRKDGISGTVLDQVPGEVNVQRPRTLIGVDASPAASQKYVLTLKRNSGSNVSVSFRRMIGGNRKK